MKKVKSLTKAVTQNELLELRERITEGIISIQPSYFATCVPRDGAEHRAKCAELGEVNPQNAKPEFCLNCTHAIITEVNLRGIWVTVQPIVKEALDDNVIGFMVEHHLPTLRSAYKRITELKTVKNEESVFKMLQYIKKAIASVNTKLKEDECLDG